MVTAREVKGLGGHDALLRLRAAWARGIQIPGLAGGGPVVVPHVQAFDDTFVSTTMPTRVAVAVPTSTAGPVVDARAIAEELAAILRSHPRLAVTNINPVARDGMQQAWEQAQEEGLL